MKRVTVDHTAQATHGATTPAPIGADTMAVPPSTYDNPREDDPWDNDAVQWLLLQPGGSSCTRHNLAECLRHQPARVKKQPELVQRAE